MAISRAFIVIALTFAAAACARTPAREYELRGQIIAVDQARQEVTIRHEDIPRFMPGMTMAFKVSSKDLLQGRAPGDLVKATLVVADTQAHLRTLERTGFSTLSEAESTRTPMTLLAAGEEVHDTQFVDESGTPRRLSDWRGLVLAVTFVYTRCPLPNFCPLMDRHFKVVQERIQSDAALARGARLLSVSFDPKHDTPPVLSKHAASLQADPAVWRFLTGRADDIEKFARQFGVSIMREAGGADQEIVHNLRTAIVDSRGRLVTVLNGSEWTPSELVMELQKALTSAPSR